MSAITYGQIIAAAEAAIAAADVEITAAYLRSNAAYNYAWCRCPNFDPSAEQLAAYKAALDEADATLFTETRAALKAKKQAELDILTARHYMANAAITGDPREGDSWLANLTESAQLRAAAMRVTE